MYKLTTLRDKKEVSLKVYTDTQVRALRKEGFEIDMDGAKDLVTLYNEEIRNPRHDQPIKIGANEKLGSIIAKLQAVKMLVVDYKGE